MSTNMYNKLITGFEERLVMYTNTLKVKAENKMYSDEDLKFLFENVKEEWRNFDKLITGMMSYEVLKDEEYKKLYEDGYKKYKEYFNTCVAIILNRQ